MVQIPDSHKDLFERSVFMTLATVMPDGRPQVTPVWVTTDGTHIIVNTARGRQKDKNMSRNGMATLCGLDPDNPYRWIEVRGRVAEVTEEGGVDSINQLSHKYTGNPDYYAKQRELADRETRVIYKIRPEHINTGG